jgi:hypothetical protein
MRWKRYAIAGLAAGLVACSGGSPVGPVDDPVFTVLGQGFALATGSDPQALFEGIAADEAGSVYVASFARGTIVRMRASDLSIVGSTAVPQSVEGLAVAPGAGPLLAVHQGEGLSVVEIPGLTPLALHSEAGGFFVEVLDADRVLTSGGRPLTLINPASGESLVEFTPPGGASIWHFAVSPDGTRIAALRSEVGGREIHILTSDLEAVGVLDLSAYNSLHGIAYHPGGTKLYVLARDLGQTDHFLAIDLVAERAVDVALGQSGCSVLCVANPVATSREGRWVVFAQETGAFFVDTQVDRPVAQLRGVFVGSGVAASPTEDAFFFVRHDGLVTKVSYPQGP